jgi:hypothetical protein
VDAGVDGRLHRVAARRSASCVSTELRRALGKAPDAARSDAPRGAATDEAARGGAARARALAALSA